MNKATRYYFTTDSVREYIDMSEGMDGREIIEKLELELSEGSSILELGSGPGRDLALLSRKYNATGSDISPLFLEHCQLQLADAELILLDAVTIDTSRKFDGIFSNKVFQHLSDKDLKQSVLRQTEILNNGGIVCHTFWEGDGEEYVEDLRFNYQKTGDLRKLFSEWFNIIEISIYKEIRANDSVLLLARKK